MSEKYIELYKKYRPKRWEDIIGQEAIITPIKNAISSNKIPTGYIFSGLAGTGKTTLALLINSNRFRKCKSRFVIYLLYNRTR